MKCHCAPPSLLLLIMQVLFDALINYTPGVGRVLTLKTLARVSDSDIQMTHTIIAGCSLVNPTLAKRNLLAYILIMPYYALLALIRHL
jgi:hypothetical protein